MGARGRRGMTLIEIAISVVVLAGALGVPVMLLLSGSRAYAVETASSATSEALRKGVAGIAARLKPAISAGVTPPPGVSEWIEYNRGVGYQGGASPALPGPLERIEFEYSPSDPDDGLDNDGNGLVDDGRAVWIESPGPNERRVTLAELVPEAQAGEILGNGVDDNGNGLVDEMGLALDITARRVVIHLTVAHPGPDGALITRNTVRTVAFRN